MNTTTSKWIEIADIAAELNVADHVAASILQILQDGAPRPVARAVEATGDSAHERVLLEMLECLRGHQSWASRRDFVSGSHDAIAENLEHIAWHEAGHAIVAGALGHTCEIDLNSVFNIDEIVAHGVTHFNTWATLAYGTTGYETIPVLFAGYLAERRVNLNRKLALRAATRDLVHVDHLDPYLYPAGRGAVWRRETFPTRNLWRRFVQGQIHVAARILRRNAKGHRALVDLLLNDCGGEMDSATFSEFVSEYKVG